MEAATARGEVLERERRWALPVALLTLAGIALLVAARVVGGSLSSDGEAEFLQSVSEHSSDAILSGVLQGLAFALFVAPLVYLFLAARARSELVRQGLIGLVVAAPLFLATASVLNAIAVDEAASSFAAGEATADLSAKEATADCRSEREDDAAAFREDFGGGEGRGPLHSCVTEAVADDRAIDALTEASARAATTGFALAGRLGLAFALFYCSLWAMRTGLLTRFWGSLGMAFGVAAILLAVEFSVIWFLYFAFLAAGWVPGGRPPAWETGEAIPWPTPGEKAAAELEPESSDAEDPPERNQSQ